MINFKRIPKERFTGEWIDFILFNWFGGIEEISLHLYKKSKKLINYGTFKIQ